MTKALTMEMAPWHGNAFRIADPLCGESTTLFQILDWWLACNNLINCSIRIHSPITDNVAWLDNDHHTCDAMVVWLSRRWYQGMGEWLLSASYVNVITYSCHTFDFVDKKGKYPDIFYPAKWASIVLKLVVSDVEQVTPKSE